MNTTPAPSAQAITLNFGDMIMKVIGDYEVHGKFIGTHPVGPGYIPILMKGKVIGKRWIRKHDAPFIEPVRLRVARFNKYDHKNLEALRYHNSLANEVGMELVF